MLVLVDSSIYGAGWFNARNPKLIGWPLCPTFGHPPYLFSNFQANCYIMGGMDGIIPGKAPDLTAMVDDTELMECTMGGGGTPIVADGVLVLDKARDTDHLKEDSHDIPGEPISAGSSGRDESHDESST